MKYILHIDTSGEKALVAIARDGQMLHKRTSEGARNHAAAINILVDETLRTTEMALHHLSGISVIGGPGSYTGLRIGLATAKAYCYVLDIPLIMSNKLDLLALQLIMKKHVSGNHYLTMLPARDKEHFICMYNNESKQLIAPQHVFEDDLEQIIKKYKDNLIVTGMIAASLKEILSKYDVLRVDNEGIDTDFWCTWSLSRYNCNDFVILPNAVPFYLKQVFTHNKL